MCKNPLPLELPLPNTPFTVFTDASQYAWAGVVIQKREDNTLRIAGVVSKKFTGCELNWHVSHKECYAVIATLWKFQHILMGTPIHVLTDHRNLVKLFSSSVLDKIGKAKIMRWFASISVFDVTFHYFEGKLNTCADFLSMPLPNMENPTLEYHNKTMRVFNTWVINYEKILSVSGKICSVLFTNQCVTQKEVNTVRPN